MNALTKIAAVLIVLAAFDGCAANPQEKYAAFIENGKKYLNQKDYARATLEFKNASQVEPNNAEPHYQLALAYLATSDLRIAVSHLRKATELNPKHKDAQLALVQLMAASQNKELVQDAEKRVRQVLDDSPTDADALSALATVEWYQGRPEEAEAHLGQAFEKSPENLRSSFNLVRLKLAQKDLTGAEEVLKKVLEVSPDRIEAPLALGAFYVLTGRPEDGERQFRRALQVDGKNGLALVSLAGIKLRAGLRNEAEDLYKKAAEQDDARYKPAHAVFLFQSGRREEAIARFEKLAKADPTDREARSRLVSAYLGVRRLQDAEKTLRAALQRNPKDLDALLQSSQVYLHLNQYAEAEAELAKVLHLEPNSAMAHYLMARIHQRNGVPLRRREELTEAIRLAPTLLPARIELAQALTSTNAARSALQVLNETPDTQKNTLPVLVQKNWANLALGNMVEAGKGIQLALGAAKRPDLLVQSAILQAMQQNYAGARRSLEEALKLNPEDSNALNVLVQIYSAQNQLPAALQKVREYTNQRPASPRLQHYLGDLLLRSGNLAEARKAFNAAKSADPAFAPAALSLVQLDIVEGKLDEARKTLSTIVSTNPSEIRPRLLLAGLEEQSGMFSEAVEHYKKVIALDERHIVALNNLAFLLAEHGKQPDEALKVAERARAVAPENANILDTLGWIYYRKGLYSMAIKTLEQAVSKEPSGLRMGHLAAAYIKAGDRQRGWAVIDGAVKLDPKLMQSKSFQNMLAELR